MSVRGRLDHALDTLRAQDYPVRHVDAARLSVYQYAHINVHGHYSFVLPDLAGGRRHCATQTRRRPRSAPTWSVVLGP
jgi:hypothetical protein